MRPEYTSYSGTMSPRSVLDRQLQSQRYVFCRFTRNLEENEGLIHNIQPQPQSPVQECRYYSRINTVFISPSMSLLSRVEVHNLEYPSTSDD